jgi:hypothetical protein
VTWALTDPTLDERQVLMAILDRDPTLTDQRIGLTIIADKGYVSAELDCYLADRGIALLRPSYRNRTPGEHLLKPIRQLIESVNDTLKGQLDLELHGGRSIDGVSTRIAQRLLALTAAIWHNRATGQPAIPDRLRPLIEFGLTCLVLGGQVDQDLGELAVDGDGGEASEEVADLVPGHGLPFIEGAMVDIGGAGRLIRPPWRWPGGQHRLRCAASGLVADLAQVADASPRRWRGGLRAGAHVGSPPEGWCGSRSRRVPARSC